MLISLLDAARDEGREESWQALIDAVRPWLVRLAKRILRDDARAEDCVQDLLSRLPAEVQGVRWISDQHARHWLARRLVNLAVNDSRREHARRRVQGEAARRQVGAASESPSRDEALVAVRESLAGLAPDERALIEDRFLRQCSYSDMATARGLTEPAVRKRVERTLERLRERLRTTAGRITVASLLLLLARLGAAESPRSLTRTVVVGGGVALVLGGVLAGWWLTRTEVFWKRTVTADSSALQYRVQGAIDDLPAADVRSTATAEPPQDPKETDMRILAPMILAAAVAGADTKPPVASVSVTGPYGADGKATIYVNGIDQSGIRSATVTVDGHPLDLHRFWAPPSWETATQTFGAQIPRPAGRSTVRIRAVVTDKAGNTSVLGGVFDWNVRWAVWRTK